MKRTLAVIVIVATATTLGALWKLRAPATAARAAPVERDAPRRNGGPSSVSLVGVRTERDDSFLARFEGRVVSAQDGAGVAKAELTFAIGETVATTLTDASGAFVFRATAIGTHELVGIAANGFSPFVADEGVVRLEARKGSVITGLLFHLRRETTLSVNVTDSTGAVAEVALAVHTPGTLAVAAPRTARTIANGSAQVGAIEDDVIEATHAGYAPIVHVVTGGEIRTHRVDLKLERSTAALATVTGVVLDEHEHPIDGAKVVLLDGDGSPRGEALSGTDGTFELAGVRAGEAQRVHASKVPYLSDSQPVEPGGARVTLHLRSGCSIIGRVVESGASNAVASFTVVVQRVTGRGDVPASPTVYDADGRFEVRGALPGNYALQVLAAGYAPSTARVIEVPESCGPIEANFSLGHGGTIFGRVTDSATGESLSAQITMEGFLDDSNPMTVKSSATTDAGGHYEIGGLPAGRRSIVVNAPGHHERIVSGISVTDGDRSGPIDVALDATQAGEAAHTQITGIGAVLRPGDGSVEILNTVPGGGALAAGLTRGDQIVAVDGILASSMSFADTTEAIRGPENTTVTLGVKKNGEGEPVSITVTRKVLR